MFVLLQVVGIMSCGFFYFMGPENLDGLPLKWNPPRGEYDTTMVSTKTRVHFKLV
jgi:hypothetical protein